MYLGFIFQTSFFKSHSPGKGDFFPCVYFKQPLSFTSGWNLSYFDWQNSLPGSLLKQSKSLLFLLKQKQRLHRVTPEPNSLKGQLEHPWQTMSPKPQPSACIFQHQGSQLSQGTSTSDTAVSTLACPKDLLTLETLTCKIWWRQNHSAPRHPTPCSPVSLTSHFSKRPEHSSHHQSDMNSQHWHSWGNSVRKHNKHIFSVTVTTLVGHMGTTSQARAVWGRARPGMQNGGAGHLSLIPWPSQSHAWGRPGLCWRTRLLLYQQHKAPNPEIVCLALSGSSWRRWVMLSVYSGGCSSWNGRTSLLQQVNWLLVLMRKGESQARKSFLVQDNASYIDKTHWFFFKCCGWLFVYKLLNNDTSINW